MQPSHLTLPSVVVHRVSLARLGGARQTRNHPNEPPKVAGPLHRCAIAQTTLITQYNATALIRRGTGHKNGLPGRNIVVWK
jgi:hypothetical protein